MDDLPAPLPLSRKRQQILEAARALFLAQGYGHVSMDAMAKLAQVSKATLYAHFPSKNRLFATIVSDACRLNTMDESNFPLIVTDIAAALRQIGVRLLTFLLLPATMEIYRVVMAESVRFPELGEAFMAAGPEAFRARFMQWLQVQVAAGHLAIDNPAVAAEQFGAMLRPLRFMRATLGLPGERDDAEEIAATVGEAVETFLRRYRAAPEA